MDEAGHVTVSGTFSYKVSLEPEFDHFSGLVALRVKAFTAAQEPLTVSCIWKRSFSDRAYRMHAIQNKYPLHSVYQVSCDDLGASISVEVTPRDLDGYESGRAVASFGPVSLSPHLRCALAKAMKEEKFSTQVKTREGEMTAVVTKERVSLQTSAGEVVTDVITTLTCDRPIVEIDEMNPKCVKMTANEQVSVWECGSRQDRELLVLSIRHFQLQIYCLTPLSAQASLFISYQAEAQSQFLAHFDVGLQLSQVQKELFISLAANDQLLREKVLLRKQLQEMESEVGDTLIAYKDLVEDPEREKAKIHLEKENERLKNELLLQKTQNERLNEVIRKLERRISGLQEANNSYKTRLIDLQTELEELLVLKEGGIVTSFALEAIEPVPNSPRSSKIQTHQSAHTPKKPESHKIQQLENELSRMKSDLKSSENQMKDRFEAKCAALRKVIEMQKRELEEMKIRAETPIYAPQEEEKLADIEELQAKLTEVIKERDEFETAVKSAHLEVDKFRREAEALSAKLSRAEAQVRKAQRQVNTGCLIPG